MRVETLFRTRGRLLGALAAGATLALTSAGGTPAAAVSAPVFTDAVVVASAGGGEPSIAIDTSYASQGKNDMYVTRLSPALFHSYDFGHTWSAPVPYSVGAAHGDADVAVLPNGNVLVADLGVSQNYVQISTDRGLTFNTGTATGFESDRPWFGVGSNNNNVYLAYHDFVGEVPIVCGSNDGGATFPVCNQAFTNSDPTKTSQCAENTVMSRPMLVDPTDGALVFLYACSTAAENATHPPYGPLHDYYMARSVGPLVQGQAAAYLSKPVFLADTTGGKAPNFSNIFSTMKIDSAGNYYAVFNGTADDNHVLTNPYHVYLTVSKDKGSTWSTPQKIDSEVGGAGTHVLSDIIVTTPGNVEVAWLSAHDANGNAATGEPNGVCGSTGMTHNCTDGAANVGMAPGGPVLANWTLEMAQSTNALSATPNFSITTASGIMHTGEICSNGLVCGTSDRSLGDYITAGVDCNGNAHIAYASNPAGGTPSIHVANQTSGATIPPPPSCFAPVGALVPEVPLLPLMPLAGVAAILVALSIRRARSRATREPRTA